MSGPVAPLRPGTTTSSGLPRRVPRANLAPGIPRQVESPPPGEPVQDAQEGEAGGRSPNGVRDTLSRYRSGLERGRSAVSAGDAAAMTGPFPQPPGPVNGQGPYPEGIDDAW